MLLSNLIKNLKVKEVLGKTDIEIKDIKTDSKYVSANNLFICLNGINYDLQMRVRRN